MNRKVNGLELKNIFTKTTLVEPLYLPLKYSILEKTIEKCFPCEEPYDPYAYPYVIAWMDHQVLCCRWKGNDFLYTDSKDRIEANHIKRIRIFNETRELMLYRKRDCFSGRVREDAAVLAEEEAFTACDVIKAHQLLARELAVYVYKNRDQVVFFRHKKDKSSLDLKADDVNRITESTFIVTHNYIGRTPLAQATYIDCRFAGFSSEPV